MYMPCEFNIKRESRNTQKNPDNGPYCSLSGLFVSAVYYLPYNRKLLVLTCLKANYLILGKEAPIATLKVFLGKTCVVYAVQFLY